MTDVIYDWCKSELPSKTWRVANENSVFSLKEFPEGIGIINLTSVSNDARGWITNEYNGANDNFDSRYTGVKLLNFSLNIYGKNSYEKAEQLKNSVFFDVNHNIFNTNGITYVSSSSIRNLTNVISGEYESRAQFDIAFYIHIEYTKQIQRIDEVNINGNIDNKIATSQKIKGD